MASDETHYDVQLFSDGGCSGNPGPGGWAYVLKHPATGKQKECSGSDAETTNNRMELMAVIQGLEALKRPCRVELVTDSQYVGKGLAEWMQKWKANGWRRGSGRTTSALKNAELWQRLDAAVHRHDVTFTWVAGHTGHKENERCDKLAVAAYQQYLGQGST